MKSGLNGMYFSFDQCGFGNNTLWFQYLLNSYIMETIIFQNYANHITHDFINTTSESLKWSFNDIIDMEEEDQSLESHIEGDKLSVIEKVFSENFWIEGYGFGIDPFIVDGWWW